VPRRQRDYGAEYRSRIARGLARGRSRSEARGHPKSSEHHVSTKAADRKPDQKLLRAVGMLRQTGSVSEAARRANVSPERLRRFVSRSDFIKRQGRRYVVDEDPWQRRIKFYSDGQLIDTVVEGFEPAHIIGLYWTARDEFLRTNDPSHLAPFEGVQVTNAMGRRYTLETRPNVLYRLAAQATGDPWEQVYRIIL
jgi:hypothetical protein